MISLKCIGKYCILIVNLSLSKGSSYIERKGANDMTQPDIILKLVEMLLAERDKCINLQSKLEEQKKSKD